MCLYYYLEIVCAPACILFNLIANSHLYKLSTFQHLSSHPIKLIYLVQEFLFILKSNHYQSLSHTHFCKYVLIAYPTLKYSHENERKKINQSSWCQANSWLTEVFSIHPDVKLITQRQHMCMCACMCVHVRVCVLQYLMYLNIFFGYTDLEILLVLSVN